MSGCNICVSGLYIYIGIRLKYTLTLPLTNLVFTYLFITKHSPLTISADH